jgi:preprotein translocase subunit SecD
MIKRLNRLHHRFPDRFLLSAVAVSILSMGCAQGLKDYTQISMQAIPLSGSASVPGSSANNSARITADSLAKTQAILEARLSGLGIETAEIDAVEPDQIVVRLPQSVDALAVESVLTNPGQLHLRPQKPDTEAQLASNIENLHRLLVEQNTLVQTDKLPEADALQVKINEKRDAIAALFEPSELTGEMLSDARAKPSEEDSNLWDVNIQFNEQGAQQLAKQTKRMAGTERAIGLFLDDVLLSTPVVNVSYALKGITSGTAVISGDFTPVAAKALEVQLKSGALPVMLNTLAVVTFAGGEVAPQTAPKAVPEPVDSGTAPK